jgi:integrase
MRQPNRQHSVGGNAQTNNQETVMSYRDYVIRQTKKLSHVQVTPSGSLRAFLKVKGQTRTHIEKDTEEGARRLIKWIIDNNHILNNSGLLPDLEQLKHFTALDIINWYKEHPAPKKNPKSKLSKVDLSHLNRLAKDDIAKIRLSDESILIRAAHDYKDKRLATNEITSVEREVTLYKAMFNKAHKVCALGLPDIPNPFKDITFHYDQEDYACTRSELTSEEEAMLLRSLERDTHGSNKYYSPLAFIMALDTCLRPDELFALRHRDADTDTRRIKLRNRRTEGKGKPRSNWIIPMSRMVQICLLRLRTELMSLKAYDHDALIFPPSGRKNRWRKEAQGRQASFETVFERRVDALGLNQGREKRDRLTFRSLRRIGRVKLEHDVGLSKEQWEFMQGRKVASIDRLHYDSRERLRLKMCQDIQDKLDIFYLGKTENDLRIDLIRRGEETINNHLEAETIKAHLASLSDDERIPIILNFGVPDDERARAKAIIRENHPEIAARQDQEAMFKGRKARAGAMGSLLCHDNPAHNRLTKEAEHYEQQYVGEATKIENLGLRNFIEHRLRKAGIKTVGELIKWSESDFMRWKCDDMFSSFGGRKNIMEIVDTLRVASAGRFSLKKSY